MISSWVFIIMGIAALYSITIFIVQVIRYLIHKKTEKELLDDDLDED